MSTPTPTIDQIREAQADGIGIVFVGDRIWMRANEMNANLAAIMEENNRLRSEVAHLKASGS